MKTVFKTLTALTAVAVLAACAAIAAEPATPQAWTPGWRHEQMVKAVQDGTVTPGNGPGFGPGRMMSAGYGPGMGRGMMAAALGPDGKIDPSKLPEGCPYRQAVPGTPTK